MAEFNPFVTTQQPTLREFNPLRNLQAARETVVNPERTRVLLPLVLDTTQADVDQRIAAGQENQMVQTARQSAINTQWSRVERRIDRNFQEGLNPEDAAVQLSELVAQDPFVGRFIDPVVMSTILRSDNDLAKRSYLDRFQRVLILSDAINNRLTSASEDSYLTKAVEILDSMVAVPVFSNISANRRADFAGELTRLLDSDLSPEEFSARINEMFTQVADQGWLTQENNLFLYDLFDLIPEGGEGVQANRQTLWATFDTVAGAVGLSGAVRAGVQIGKGTARGMAEVATDASTLAARTGADTETVQEMLTTAAVRDVPNSPVNPVNHEVGVTTPLNRRSMALTPPESWARENLEVNNPYIRRVFSQIARGGQAVDDNLIQSLRTDRVFKSEEAGRRTVIDYDISVDELENVYYEETFGNKKGGYFNRISDATRLADSIGGFVTQTGENQFAVKLRMPVGYTEDMFRKTNVDALGDSFWARWGSPGSQTEEHLDAILKQSEAVQTKAIEELKGEIYRLNRTLKAKERNSVGRVFDDLRDGEMSWRRPYYSTDEFKSQFYRINGRSPTPNEVDYATRIQHLNNVDYFLKADSLFKEAASRNTRVLKIDETDNLVMTSKLEDLPDEELIWNLDTKLLEPKSKFTDKHSIFSMASDLYKTPDGQWVQYVASKKPTTRRIYHSDVLPYNAGGSRLYIPGGMKFFVKQNGDKVLASGRTVNETPKTFLAVRLQEEAQAAVDQFNNIVSAINKGLGPVPRTLDETYEAIKGLDLDEVIKDNSEWNTSIQSTDDLVEFFSENMLDPRKTVDWARDGDAVGDLTASFVNRNATYADVFRISGARKLGRRNKPLIGYGGQVVRTRPALESIKRSVLGSVATKTNATYITAAAQGLIKEVMSIEARHLKDTSLPRVLNGKVALNDLQGLTLKGKLATLYEGLNDTAQGRKLKLEIEKINFRTSVTDPVNSGFQWLKDSFADAVYRKFGDNRVTNWMDTYSSNPVTAMRGYTFDALLGFFAPDQYLVQASQVFNIVSTHPVNGFKGAALYAPLRFLVRNGKEPTIRAFGKRLAPIVGLNEDQFVEMVQMLRQDGRMVTGISVAELQDDINVGGVWSNFREKGRFFFNEGELVGRITAHAVAYMEWTTKFPGQSAMSQAGRRWITREQDRLTQSMTGASRSPFQQLPFAQFLSYSWRMTEQLFAGSLGGKSILSAQEKARMAVGHMTLFGLAGIPTGGMIFDYFYHKYGIEMDQSTYTAARYGVLDTVLSWLIGTDTAMSSRLAYGQGITETVRNFLNMNFIEAIAGPAGSVSSDLITNLTNLVKDVTHGRSELIPTDLNLLARQIKSYDMAHNVYTASVLGDYYSRSGLGVIDDDVDAYERVALAFGIPQQDYVERNTLDRLSYNDSQYEKSVGRRLEQILTGALRAYEEGNQEEGDAMRDQITVLLEAIRMRNPLQAERIINNMPRNFNSLVDEAYLRAIQRGYTVREDIQ